MDIVTLAAAALVASLQPLDPPGGTNLVPPGTITIERVENDLDAPEVGGVFAEAVQRALLNARFTALPSPSHSRYIARIAVTHNLRGTVTSDAKEAAPASNVGNWGAQLRVTLPSTKTQMRGLVVTTLTIEIALRSTDQLVWKGSALTAQVEGTRMNAPSIVAQKLADALIQNLPETLDRPISVP